MASSTRKINANRRNAQSSTGPNDTSRTRLNAMKHGILSKEALVVVGDGYENQEVFEELSSSLRRDIAPVGALEELLVDELIMLTWRRRRVLRYETGVISQHLGSIVQSFDQINNQLDQLADQTKHIDRELSALDEKDPLAARPELWTRVFEVAEGQYGVPIKELLGLEDCWDPYDTYSREEIQQVIEAACQRGEISAGEFWTAFQVKIQLEKILLTPGPTRLHLTLEQKLQLIGLPHHTTLEKIQRYEAHLSRQFYRALHELQRLQAARRGLRPPAPLAVDVDIAGGPTS